MKTFNLASNTRYITHTNMQNKHDTFRACIEKLIQPLYMNNFPLGITSSPSFYVKCCMYRCRHGCKDDFRRNKF